MFVLQLSPISISNIAPRSCMNIVLSLQPFFTFPHKWYIYLTILAYNLSFKYGIDALIFCERFLDSDLSDGLTNIFFSFSFLLFS